MKRILFVGLIISLLTGLPAFGSEKKLPIIDGKTAVASVNGEPISLEEFNRAIGAAHAARPGVKAAGRIDYSGTMNRLINTRLIMLEARNIGLDQLSEIRKLVDNYSQDTMVELLLEGQVKHIKPDQDEVERTYKQLVREWKITSVRFDTEEGVKQFEEKIAASNNFAEAVEKALEEGKAAEGEVGQYVKGTDLSPQIAQVVSKMEISSTSPVVPVGGKGFVIFRLEGERFPEKEDAEAMDRARRQVLTQERVKAAKAYYQGLRKKYVTINEDLMEGLDFESEEPGFDSLLKDKRIIVKVSGEEPVTVGELTRALKQKFYHGVESAIANKKVNKRKDQVLEAMLEKRILLKEALIQSIDKSDEYKDRIKEYEISLVYGAFINKVIAPNIKLDQKELKTYYEKNKEAYTYPEMMRIKSLVFAKKSDAVTALGKLKGGTDFDWLSSNTEEQVDKNTKGLLKLEGNLLTVGSLPEDLQKSLSKAGPGDFRLYESPDGYYYVLYIYYVLPATPQPFGNVKDEIAKKVFGDETKKAVEAYADQLKEYYPVEIYAEDLQ